MQNYTLIIYKHILVFNFFTIIAKKKKTDICTKICSKTNRNQLFKNNLKKKTIHQLLDNLLLS